jgi:transketolase
MAYVDKYFNRMDQQIIQEIEKQARDLRKHIIQMITQASSGHPGGSLSAADIVSVLYFHEMKIDSQNPDWPDRDRFILSKGHACPVWYSVLAMKGFFPIEELKTLRRINGNLQGHPDMRKTRGVDMTTGSLGCGLSAGIGMALAAKLDKKDYRVFVVLGCGELNEGLIWEAAMCAGKYKLDNLYAFVDYNTLQLDGRNQDVMPLEPLADKWRAFNWHVQEIDGHDVRQIIAALETAKSEKDRPSVIIARTVKGKGVSFMEDQVDWHGRTPTPEQCQQACREISGGAE